MRAAIRDARLLRSVPLSDVELYLAARGWTRQSRPQGKLALWLLDRADAPQAELFLPTEETVIDYATRVSEVLAALERVEDRSQLEIFRDWAFASADVVRVRRPTETEGEFSIALQEGVDLVSRARDLVTAAACAAVKAQKVIPSRRPLQAMEYLQLVRMGQTEPGSYTVTIISRVAPLMTPKSQDLQELIVPFPRLAVQTIARAATAADTAAAATARDGDFSHFEDAVKSGVSADFCEAIVGLARSGASERPVNIDITWAAARPEAEVVFSPTTFATDRVVILEEAARIFRASAPLEGVSAMGFVVDLHRDPDAEEGTVTIAAVIEDGLKKIQVALTAPDYELAIDAHKNKTPLAFTADISRVGRSFHADKVTGVKKVE